MDIIRRMIHALTVGLLGLSLALGIAAATVALIVADRDNIKSWPLDAGIYPKITGQILDSTNRANAEGPGRQEASELDRALEDSPLDRDRLEDALDEVFTPSYWQIKFESLVDSFYDWLDGSRNELQFNIVFNDRNEELAAAMETELAKQLADYPVCSSATGLDDFDPITASCLPRGLSASRAASQFAADLKEDDFLADARLSSDEIEWDQDFIEHAPATFASIKNLPFPVGLVVLVLAAVAIFTDKSRLRGIKKTGQLLFGMGLIAWLGFFVGNRIGAGFELASNPDNASEQALAEVLQPLIKVAFNDFTTTGLWVSLTVVIAGTLLWLSAFTWHKIHHEQPAAPTTAQAPKDSPKLPKPIKPDKN